MNQSKSQQTVAKALQWLNKQPHSWGNHIKDTNIAVKMYLKHQDREKNKEIKKNIFKEATAKDDKGGFHFMNELNNKINNKQLLDSEEEPAAFLKNQAPQKKSATAYEESFLLESLHKLETKKNHSSDRDDFSLSDSHPLRKTEPEIDNCFSVDSYLSKNTLNKKQAPVLVLEPSRNSSENFKPSLSEILSPPAKEVLKSTFSNNKHTLTKIEKNFSIKPEEDEVRQANFKLVEYLDKKSLTTLKEVQEKLNISNEREVLRILIQIGKNYLEKSFSK